MITWKRNLRITDVIFSEVIDVTFFLMRSLLSSQTRVETPVSHMAQFGSFQEGSANYLSTKKLAEFAQELSSARKSS